MNFRSTASKGLQYLVGVGAVAGAVLGALFPRVFGFIFEMFLIHNL